MCGIAHLYCSRIRCDVGLVLDVAAHEPTNRATFGTALVRAEFPSGSQRSALRCVRTDLPGTPFARRRIDALDPNGPLVTMLADRWLVHCLPTHVSPHGILAHAHTFSELSLVVITSDLSASRNGEI